MHTVIIVLYHELVIHYVYHVAASVNQIKKKNPA